MIAYCDPCASLIMILKMTDDNEMYPVKIIYCTVLSGGSFIGVEQ